MGKGWEWKEVAEWKEGREWKKGAGMGNEEWGGTGMKIERGRKIKTLPISPLPPFPRKRESPIVWGGAGNARTAPLHIVICAVGAGVGRFPLSREWERGVGMGKGWEWKEGAGMEERSGNGK